MVKKIETNQNTNFGGGPQVETSAEATLNYTYPETNAKINIFAESGVTGLTRFGGFVMEEWLTELQGRRGAYTYREMRDNDAVIGALLYAIEMIIRQVKWRIEAAGKTSQDIDAMNFIDGCLEDMSMSWGDTMSEILTFLPFGWSYMELCYKKRLGPTQKDPNKKSKFTDGRIGWKKWAIRAQETLWRWRFQPDGTILGMEQIAPPDYKLRYIPIEKALLFRVRSNKNSPESRSILRSAYRSWYFLKNVQEIEGIGVERDLAGYPIMWVPPEVIAQKTPEAQLAYSQYKKILNNIRRDAQEGLMMPLVYDEKGNKLYDIQLLSSGSTRRQFDTNQIIIRYEQRIAMTVLADFLMLGHNVSGSYALASTKTSLFLTSLRTILQNIADVINTHAIPRLIDLNDFSDLSGYPRIVYDEVEKVDLAALGDFIQKVSGAGGLNLEGDEDAENYLRTVSNMPKKSEIFTKPSEQINTNSDEDELMGIEKSMCGCDKHETIDRQIFIDAIQELRDSIKKDGAKNE